MLRLKEQFRMLTVAKNMLVDEQGLETLANVKQTLGKLQVKNKLIQQLHAEIKIKKDEQMKQDVWKSQLMNSCQAQ